MKINLEDLEDHGSMMVEKTKKHLWHPHIFISIFKAILTLIVTTTIIERCFSAITITKTSSL